MRGCAQCFVLQLLFVTCALAMDANYCDLCGGHHTLCVNIGCPVQGTCADFEQKPFTFNEKQIIVNKHNELRNKVALGVQPRQPKAENINKLEWSDELEKIAQCWANTCIFGHDTCRNTYNMKVGQNVASSAGSVQSQVYSKDTLLRNIENWFNEVDYFNANTLEKYSFISDTAHYTQLVWAETTLIGCAKVVFKDGTLWTIHVVCNYGPAGNVIGETIYKKGRPCAQCKNKKTCDYVYAGLCS